MAAPKGNEFWKRRSKHGRDKIVESPEIMLEAINEFFEIMSTVKLKRPELVKSGQRAGEVVNVEIDDYPLPEELAHFLGFNTLQGWLNYENHEGFLEVITYAREVMRVWKIKGAAIGNYNQSIVARELGLKEQSEVNTNASINILNIDPLSDDE